jgi:Na+/phosphate symporter
MYALSVVTLLGYNLRLEHVGDHISRSLRTLSQKQNLELFLEFD